MSAAIICGLSLPALTFHPELSPFLLGYSSLLARCLRLVSYATGALPHLRLRAFNRRSSLPSLCYRIARNFVAVLLREIPAANDHGGGGLKRSRLLDLLPLTSIRERSELALAPGRRIVAVRVAPTRFNQKALLKVSADLRYFRMLNV